MKTLTDTFGRKFPYIRLSITDVCNYKCTYCLPQGYKKNSGDVRSFMSTEEISRLAKSFLAVGSPPVSLILQTPSSDKAFASLDISSPDIKLLMSLGFFLYP